MVVLVADSADGGQRTGREPDFSATIDLLGPSHGTSCPSSNPKGKGVHSSHQCDSDDPSGWFNFLCSGSPAGGMPENSPHVSAERGPYKMELPRGAQCRYPSIMFGKLTKSVPSYGAHNGVAISGPQAQETP